MGPLSYHSERPGVLEGRTQGTGAIGRDTAHACPGGTYQSILFRAVIVLKVIRRCSFLSAARTLGYVD